MCAKRSNIHYAWFILTACCFLCFGSGGILYNSIGIFMPPVCKDLNFTASQFSLYLNIRQIIMVLLLPVAGILIPRIHPRILLTGAGILGVLSLGILAETRKLWHLYLAGGACGAAAAFLIMTMAPILLKKWFKKKYGMAIGIAMAFTGIGGTIMNPVGAVVIERYGWRVAAWFLAVVSGLCILPFTLFVLKRGPEELGILAYGEDQESTQKEMKEKSSARKPDGQEDQGGQKQPDPSKNPGKQASDYSGCLVLGMILLNSMLIAIPQAFNSHCSQFAVSVGRTAIEGAGMSSAFMMGNTLGKLGLGWLAEKLSTFRTVMLGAVLVIAGFGLMAVSSGYLILLTAALLGGVSMSLTSIAVPLLVADFYTSADYDMKLSYATMSSMFITGIAMSLLGWGYDALGTYRPCVFFMMGTYGVLLATLHLLYKKKAAQVSGSL